MQLHAASCSQLHAAASTTCMHANNFLFVSEANCVVFGLSFDSAHRIRIVHAAACCSGGTFGPLECFLGLRLRFGAFGSRLPPPFAAFCFATAPPPACFACTAPSSRSASALHASGPPIASIPSSSWSPAKKTVLKKWFIY